MEFKKNKSSKNTGGLAKSSGGKVTPIRKGGNGSFNLNPTSVSGSQVLAVNPQAQSMLESLFGEFGLQLPELNMGDPNLSKKVVEIGKVAEVARKNKAAVRTLLKHVGALMSAEVTKAQFYDAATQIVIEGKRTIDRATANAFLSLYNYNKSVDHLQGAVERKTQAIDAQYEYLGQMGRISAYSPASIGLNPKSNRALSVLLRQKKLVSSAQLCFQPFNLNVLKT